jgi:hypothetical protein
MSILFLMILFVILSPGMFLSIPPVGGRWWMTGKMSLRAVFVHAAVFAVILYVAQRMMLTEGFIAPIRGSASVPMRGPVQPPSMRGPVQPPSMRGSMQPPSMRGSMQPPSMRGPAQPPSMRGPVQPPSMRGSAPSPSMRGPVQPPSMRGPMPAPMSASVPAGIRNITAPTKVAGSIATALRGVFPSFMGIPGGMAIKA